MEYAIGVDLGGTKIEAVLINSKGKILYTKRNPTEAKENKNKIINNIVSTIEDVRSFSKKKGVKNPGIGIGTPGYMDPQGKMRIIANIPSFEGTNIKSALEKSLKKKVIIENDANCFALAEHNFGAAKGSKDSIGIIWGTGIGAGIIINNKIHRGYLGSAGEFGTFTISPDSPIKDNNAKLYGDIESYCSAPNLIKWYKYLSGKNEEVDSKFIMERKDEVAERVADQCIKYLSIGIAMLVNILNPQTIVMGGGVSRSNSINDLRNESKKYVDPRLVNTYTVNRYNLGDAAGVIGAGCLALKK